MSINETIIDYETIIDKLLKEDNKLQTILIPTVNNPIESQSGGKIIFKNKETFQGKMLKNNMLIEGIYTWPNGQTYFGGFNHNNLFNKKGKIIFPDESELIGTFDGKNNIIDKAIYKTNLRVYQGAFKNNKLHGKFIIKNKDEYPHYLYIGNYYNGAKNGKFTLEKSYHNEKYKITGNYKEGIKYGEFKVLNISKNEEKNMIYDGDFPIYKPNNEDLIENKDLNFIERWNKINCMKIINDKLLLGSYEYLVIYYINNKDYSIRFDRKILIFRNEDINDFIQTEYKKILLCSSKNNFKLIELELDERNNSYSYTTMSANSDFHLIQEFKGLQNSKNIFCVVELSNNMIVSGDCENIILWDYININNDNILCVTDNNNVKEKSFWDKFKETIFGPDNNDNENVLFLSEHNSAIPLFEYKLVQNEKLSHIYSIVEIKHSDNEIIIGAAEPDSKSIIIMKIENKEKIYKLKKIECHDEIMKKKNIMKCFDNKLFIGCKNKLIVIDINKYEIIYNVFSENITYLNMFLDKYIICGVTKKLNNLYDYEGYLLQKNILKIPNSGQMKIINISSFTKLKNKGNIVDACIYNNGSIITADTDGKILMLK